MKKESTFDTVFPTLDTTVLTVFTAAFATETMVLDGFVPVFFSGAVFVLVEPEPELDPDCAVDDALSGSYKTIPGCIVTFEQSMPSFDANIASLFSS